MTINIEHYPCKTDEFQESVLDGEMILYSVSSEQAVYLNESSRLIFELCDGQHSIADINNLLQQAYPEAGSVLQQNIVEAVQSLQENGVLVLQEFAAK